MGRKRTNYRDSIKQDANKDQQNETAENLENSLPISSNKNQEESSKVQDSQIENHINVKPEEVKSKLVDQSEPNQEPQDKSISLAKQKAEQKPGEKSELDAEAEIEKISEDKNNSNVKAEVNLKQKSESDLDAKPKADQKPELRRNSEDSKQVADQKPDKEKSKSDTEAKFYQKQKAESDLDSKPEADQKSEADSEQNSKASAAEKIPEGNSEQASKPADDLKLEAKKKEESKVDNNNPKNVVQIDSASKASVLADSKPESAKKEEDSKVTAVDSKNDEDEKQQNAQKDDKVDNQNMQEENKSNQKTSREFIDEKKEAFFKLIDFSSEKQNLHKLKENLQKYFSKESISELLNQGELDDGQQIKSRGEIEDILSKFSKSKNLLIESNQTLENYLKNFANDLNQLLKKHNYYDEANETYKKIDAFRPSAFNDAIINKFKSKEKDSSIDNFNYKNKYEKYKGEKIVEDSENKICKKRHGFGYYLNKNTNRSFLGLFDNDEYTKGYLEIENIKIFNGEFISNKESFDGLYVTKDEAAKTVYMMLGETNLKQKTFNGLFIKLQNNLLSLYFGELKEQLKNSENSIQIDFKIKNFKLDENNLKFKLSYGDFENDKPVFSEKNNDFFFHDNSSLLKSTENNVFSVYSIDKELNLISQGEIQNEVYRGKAILFDSQNNIYYSGEMEDGNYKGKGSLITFDFENNLSKAILVRGDIEQTEIKDCCVYFYKKENGSDKFTTIENAVLSTNFDLKRGKINFEDKEFYEGEFQNFSKHGIGKYEYRDGSSYDGEWKNDKKDGKGVYLDSEKREFEGIWVDDRIQK